MSAEKNNDAFISANEDIDVMEIMSSIQKRIQEKKDSGVLKQIEVDEINEMELLPLPDFLEVPNVYQPHLYPGSEPDESPKEEFHNLVVPIEDERGGGVKGVIKKILVFKRKIFFPLIRFMTRPIYNELKQYTGDRYNDNARQLFYLKQDADSYKRLIFQSKEYIKLMHNAMNNMMVEFSKLKIDAELLKTRIKVMEDKVEFLENRERAIEKKLFEAPSDDAAPKSTKKKNNPK